MLSHLPGDQLERFTAHVDQLLQGWDDHRSDTSAVRTETAKLQRSVTLLHGRTAQPGGSRREEDANLEVNLQAIQGRMQTNHEAIVNLLEEARRDAATNSRLWQRLAQRYGWLDDDENGDQQDTPT